MQLQSAETSDGVGYQIPQSMVRLHEPDDFALCMLSSTT
jgi:hypothetical protein